jgi:hypothetical protein
LDPVAKTCTCPAVSSVLITGVCVNCTAIANNNGPNATNVNCNCITPYQWNWNTTTLVGTCFCNSAFEITIGSAPGCLDCTTLTYATGTVTSNVCNCKPNFLWNATSLNCYCPVGWTVVGLTCICPTATSAVISGYCVDCATVTNGATPNGNHDNCVCTVPYQWGWDALTNVAGTCTCNLATEITIAAAPGCFDCSTVTHGKGTATSNACDCNTNFLWNATGLNCYCPVGWAQVGPICICPTASSAVISGYCVDCATVINVAAPNFNYSTCVCTYPYKWNWNALTNLAGTCTCDPTSEITISSSPGCFDCTTLTYGPGTVKAPGICDCDPGFLWNATGLTCYCPSGWSLNTFTFTCTCPTATSAVIQGYCVNCSSITHNEGPNSNYTICNCISPYQWNWNALTNLAGTCTCNPATEITIAAAPGCFDCSTLTYGKGTATSNACDCILGFSWNATSNTCYCPSGWSIVGLTCICPTATSAVISGYCVDCATVTNVAAPNSNYTNCVCTVPYQWNWDALTNVAGTCTCNLATEITITAAPGCFDCSTVTHGKGTATSNACDCNTNFLWNATSYTCYCPVGWSQVGLTCICPPATSALISGYCVDCATVTNGATPNGNHDNCVCTTPYQWNWDALTNVAGTCTCNPATEITIAAAPHCFNCSTVTYGKGTATSNACDCISGFLWNATDNTCYCPVGWTQVGLTCTCPTTTNAVIDGYCVNCTLIAGNAGPNSNHTACDCITSDTWSWDSLHQIGYCTCNSTYEINVPTVNGIICVDCTKLLYTTGTTNNN